MKTFEAIQNECSGTVYKIADFIKLVQAGYIIDYDGIGYFHDGEDEVDYPPVTCNKTKLSCYAKDYPYVCWYNR